MVLFDGLTTHLDILLQKGLRYKQYHHNYEIFPMVILL